MLSSTGGVDAKNSSSGAVVVGEGKCAAGAKVYVGFAVSEVVPANCARVGENVAAAKVGSTDKLIATNKRNVSSPASKFASATKNDDQFKAFGDGLVSGGSGPGGWVGQDNAHGQGMADVRIVGVTGMFSGFPHMTKPRGTPEALPKFYWAVLLQQMWRFLLLRKTLR
jgi:hypothetical protein